MIGLFQTTTKYNDLIGPNNCCRAGSCKTALAALPLAGGRPQSCDQNNQMNLGLMKTENKWNININT